MMTSLFRAEHIAADDTGDIQTASAYGHASERLDAILRIQSHGFSSNPPVGSHGIGLRLRGESDLAVLLGLEHQDTRPRNLGVGDSALYNADGSIWRMVGKNPTFDALGDVVLTAKSFTFKCGGVTMKLSGDGLALTGGSVTHNRHDIGATHQHTNTQPGGGLSGVPQ